MPIILPVTWSHDEVFGVKSMLQIWNLKLEPCITIQCLSVEFHPVCPIQQSGILPQLGM